MIDYSGYLSRASRGMRASPIRRASEVAAASVDLISLAPGFPDPDLFPCDEIAEVTRGILSGPDRSALQYGPTRGYAPLLGAIPAILEQRHIFNAGESIVTTGSQQALDLCARVLVDPGDAVIVELPTYSGAIMAFSNAQAKLAGVRLDADGIDLADLDAVVARERAAGRRVAFVYVIPNFQNPAGVLATLRRRLELLEWAARRDVLIVEDDPYGAIYFDDVASEAETRPIKADDREGRVVYMSTFSKTVAPGLRVAWISAPSPVISRIEIAKQATDLCSSSLDQRIIHAVWKSGAIDRRLPLLRDAYRRRRAAMEGAISQAFGSSMTWDRPKGGFFVWARFPAGVDAERLLSRAVAQGVLYVPGSAFYVEAPDRRAVRLSFSVASPEQLQTAITRLAAAVGEESAEAEAKVTARRSPASS